MDAMQLAQMKRTIAWQEQETAKLEREMHDAELAAAGAKKKAEELRAKITQNKHVLARLIQEMRRAEDQVRRQNFQKP